MLVALTRPVPPSITECELTHLERAPIDWERARAQHTAYEEALKALGCRVERLAGQPAQPDSVFIEDTAVVVDEIAVIARPGAASRRGETPIVRDALRRYRRVAAVEAPGTLDGGDVLRVGRQVYVGLSSRTNAEGARQLAAALTPCGYSVETIVVKDCLHLKTAVSALGDDRVLLNADMVRADAFAPSRPPASRSAPVA